MAIKRKNGSISFTADLKQNLLNERERGELKNQWLEKRFEEVLPLAMERAGLDMWLIISREYNEDPVLMSMTPSPAMNAFGRPFYVFTKQADGSVERLYIQLRSDTHAGRFFTNYPGNPGQDKWSCLLDIIEEKQPKNIGVNYSILDNHCDGIGTGDFMMLKETLGEKWFPKVVSAETAAIAWLETRIEEEIAAYETVCNVAHSIIDEAFSRRVITPGVTTCLDVEWWIRQRMEDLRCPPWFIPNISIFSPDKAYYEANPDSLVIMPGDVIWSDFGIEYLGLCTDQQEVGYILKPGETDAPEGLKNALKNTNRMQEILREHMRPGNTGNEAFLRSHAQMKEEGIEGHIFTHPIGTHGHGAGPTIGRYGSKDPIPVSGDRVIEANTVFSMELCSVTPMPEWGGKTINLHQEEEVVVLKDGTYYLDGRQEELHLI